MVSYCGKCKKLTRGRIFCHNCNIDKLVEKNKDIVVEGKCGCLCHKRLYANPYNICCSCPEWKRGTKEK